MGLQLTLTQGERFYVGERVFTVEEIVSSTRFILRDDTGRLFQIDDSAPTLVGDQITIMSGTRGQNNLARVVIDAPKEMRISRDQRGN